MSNTPNQRLIRLKTVMEKTGLSRPYVYALSKDGKFPRSVKLTERSVAWIESEVDQWIADRINARVSA